MSFNLDSYLDSLLAFVPKSRGNRAAGDYLALIHVPVAGPERVYSLRYDDEHPVLCVASYRESLWDLVDAEEGARPDLDALQVALPADHPALDFLGLDALSACRNYSDGRPGMDYYLMIWQRQGEADVVECWEPYLRRQDAWAQIIGAMQVLASQYERAAQLA